jgi:cytoskeletal protein CcmA (bactofilin family)
MDVKDFVAVRNFRTANSMHIRKKGRVHASVWAEDLTIEGLLLGSATALNAIHITRKAKVTGALRASRLVVESGAELSGQVAIGPECMPELLALRATLPGEAMDEMEARFQGPRG